MKRVVRLAPALRAASVPGAARARVLGYNGVLGCPLVAQANQERHRSRQTTASRVLSTAQDVRASYEIEEHEPTSAPSVAPNVAPEPMTHAGGMLGYARRVKAIDMLQLCSQLQIIDRWTGEHVVRSSGDLAHVFGHETVERIVPIFREMASIKELNAMYLERRRSLGSQKQAAEHAALHLEDTIEALGKELEQQYYKLNSTIDGYAADRLKVRFEAQIDALNEEAETAGTLAAQIENTAGPRRAIEAVVTLKLHELQEELVSVLAELRRQNLQLFYRDRDEADNLEALA